MPTITNMCLDLNCPCQDAARARDAAVAAMAATAEAVSDTPPQEAAAVPEAPAEEEEPLCGDCEYPQDECECMTCERRGPHRVNRDEWHETCGLCRDHCECTSCASCDRSGPELWVCDLCNCCDNCCDDPYCGDCEDRVRPSRFCTECDRCSDHCDCNDGEESDENEGGGTSSGARSSPRFFPSVLTFHRGRPCGAYPSARYGAVEIEVASATTAVHYADGTGRPTLRELSEGRWKFGVVRDGSLGTYGFEINTSPASGAAFVEQITAICELLNRGGAKVDRSCGLHVHLDGRRLTATDVIRVAALAHTIYGGVAAVVPASRRETHYAKKLPAEFLRQARRSHGEGGLLRYRSLATAVYEPWSGDAVLISSSDILRLRGDKYHSARYSWVNVHSWFHRKTIEIRIHSGTTSPRKIILWAGFWAALVDRATRMTDADVLQFEQDYTANPWAGFMALQPTAEHAEHFAARRQTFDSEYDPASDHVLQTTLSRLVKPVQFTLNLKVTE